MEPILALLIQKWTDAEILLTAAGTGKGKGKLSGANAMVSLTKTVTSMAGDTGDLTAYRDRLFTQVTILSQQSDPRPDASSA